MRTTLFIIICTLAMNLQAKIVIDERNDDTIFTSLR